MSNNIKTTVPITRETNVVNAKATMSFPSAPGIAQIDLSGGRISGAGSAKGTNDYLIASDVLFMIQNELLSGDATTVDLVVVKAYCDPKFANTASNDITLIPGISNSKLLGPKLTVTEGGRRLYIGDQEYICLGLHNIKAEEVLRGRTMADAWITEANLLASEGVFKMIDTGVSVEGGRLLCDLNEDDPDHWIYKWIDKKPELLKPGFFDTFDSANWMPSMNRHNPSEYLKKLESSFRGLWYDRFILGKRVRAEGLVFGEQYSKELYNSNDPTQGGNLILLVNIRDPDWISVGIDGGLVHPCAFSII